MYIIKNAFRCISRAKGRNILIGLVVMLLSVASCLGLSIRQANKTLKKQYADQMEITASLGAKSRENQITLEDLTKLSSDKSVKSFYKSASVTLSAGEGIEPIDVAGSFKQNKDFKNEYGDIKNGETQTETVEGTSNSSASSYKIVTLANENADNTAGNAEEGEVVADDNPSTADEQGEQKDEETQEGERPSKPDMSGGGSSSDSHTPPSSGSDSSSGEFTHPQMPSGDTFINKSFFFNMASMNDFTVIGGDGKNAFPEYISSLECLDGESADYKCVISKNLADENELQKGDTFTVVNPENENETYTLTVGGIFDSSKATEGATTSSNAGFTDNKIYVNYATVEEMLKASASLNGEATTEKNDQKLIALSAAYEGTFSFKNLSDFNSFKKLVSDKYEVNSEDVEKYNQSVEQLDELGEYAKYFLIVIFLIGAFVLIIINLFSIRNRKYEIGVLTAIGMKKYKVALQFITELFVVTFAALIIGSTIGAVSSVPVTNKLLKTVATTQTTQSQTSSSASSSERSKTIGSSGASADMKDNMPQPPQDGGKFGQMKQTAKNYIASVNSATNLTVILEMIGVGIILTLISSLAAMLFVMRYEPLKILNNRD